MNPNVAQTWKMTTSCPPHLGPATINHTEEHWQVTWHNLDKLINNTTAHGCRAENLPETCLLSTTTSKWLRCQLARPWNSQGLMRSGFSTTHQGTICHFWQISPAICNHGGRLGSRTSSRKIKMETPRDSGCRVSQIFEEVFERRGEVSAKRVQLVDYWWRSHSLICWSLETAKEEAHRRIWRGKLAQVVLYEPTVPQWLLDLQKKCIPYTSCMDLSITYTDAYLFT